jgi:molybdopterin/thiamine biosynthesis adenylyltransferase
VNTHRDALARTTLLLNEEWFSGEANEAAIADALLACTVRFVADDPSLSSRAGQTALVTAFMLTARLGIGIELQVPNTPLLDPVAPLREPRLVEALVDLGSDLIPGALVRTTLGEVDETFVLAASSDEFPSAIRITATDLKAGLERGGRGAPSMGDLPFGGLAAGAAIAAMALEAARPRIEDATGLSGRTARPSPGPPVRIDLAELFPRLAAGLTTDLGRVDTISGGAISHALLYCLLRVPGLRAQIRVIEKQSADISNINRYSLLRTTDEHTDKVQLLEAAATDRIEINGVRTLFTKETRGGLLPLADRVVVGVDDVEARWWVQEAEPAWLAIGATSNHLAQLTTHMPDSPCAACLHPVALVPATIPTISFVSFWAGLLQACGLLSGSSVPRNLSVYPFALGGTSWVISVPLVPNRECRIGCRASQRAGSSPTCDED